MNSRLREYSNGWRRREDTGPLVKDRRDRSANNCFNLRDHAAKTLLDRFLVSVVAVTPISILAFAGLDEAHGDERNRRHRVWFRDERQGSQTENGSFRIFRCVPRRLICVQVRIELPDGTIGKATSGRFAGGGGLPKLQSLMQVAGALLRDGFTEQGTALVRGSLIAAMNLTILWPLCMNCRRKRCAAKRRFRSLRLEAKGADGIWAERKRQYSPPRQPRAVTVV